MQETRRRSRWDGDRDWLAVMVVLTISESLLWLVDWLSGSAPIPLVGTYVLLALAGLAGAAVLRLATPLRAVRTNWTSAFAGTLLIALAGSLFLPLKYAIPRIIPFWLDRPLAAIEGIGGIQPWQLLDRALGWAMVPVDRVYALWLPVQALVLYSVMLSPAGAAKSRALIAYALAWVLLGVVAALLLSSAGPIFINRLYGAPDFAGLRDTLHRRGAAMVLAESDAMWRSFASGRPTLVAGISAMPSLHVAISVWIWLVAREMAARAAPVALAYALFMWVASVQLGWHYALDGIAGAAGMIAVWAVTRPFQAFLHKRLPVPGLR